MSDPTRTDGHLREDAEALAHVGSFATVVGASAPGYWSQECRRILGMGPDAQLDEDGFAMLVHPDDRAAFARGRESALAARAPLNLLFRVRRLSDGETRWLEARVRPTYDEGSRCWRISGALYDATERRDAVERLRASETRFRRLFTAGFIGISIGDGSGAVFEANDAYLSMLGFSRDDLEQGLIRWTERTPEEHRAGDRIANEQIAAHGVASPWEKEFLRKDGVRVPVFIGVASLDDGTRITVVNDLSERKRAEAALRESEAKLSQAQKMEAIGRLAGGVAHDFNNVLSVILSYGTLLASDLKPTDPMVRDLEEITAAAKKAAEMTRQLLAFSRRQVLEPRVVDLNETLAGQERMLRRLIGEDIVLEASYAPELWKVRVDPGQIEQVIMNLVVNARDAMPAGGRLTIETANVEIDPAQAAALPRLKPGPHVRITVRDTGHGMSRETMRRIFDPFFTMKPKGRGTGLGLSSSLGIAQQSQGAIGVESVLGGGATFFLYLPTTSASAREDAPRPTGAPRLRGRETILLVEDEDAVRTTARAILQRFGYRVLEARNGGEALLTCEQYPEKIDAMLSDVVMPLLSGPQLAGRVGGIRPEMRVIFMSGYADGASSIEDLESRTFIQKPFTPETLAAGVRAVLDSPEAE